MQPQGPYGPSGPQPYNPQGMPMPQNPQSRPYPVGPNGQPYPAAPGQNPLPGQMPQPGQPLRPQIPGQPAMPQYQMPQGRGGRPGAADNLPPAPDAPATPYDFFMQPKPAAPLTPLPASGKHLGNYPGKDEANKNKKFIPIVAGALGLIIVLVLATALIPKDQTPIQFFSLAQRQQEIIRVCAQGTTKSKYRATRNFAITCSTGVTNSQKQLLAYMDKTNLTYESKQIGAKANGATDSKLKSGTSSSTYDDTFREIMKSELGTYNRALTAQLGITTGANGRDVLTKNQRAAELLLLMVADDSDKTEAVDDVPVTE